MSATVTMVKINGLQFNANRDPQAYRRGIGETFRLEAVIAGRGPIRCKLLDERGTLLHAESLDAPGTYRAELAFDRPGSRLVTIDVETGASRYVRDLRLDVLEHAWIG